jgi:hypothetical protein
MKGKIPAAQVLTANRLRDGAVAYRTPDGEWVTDINAGEIAPDMAAAERLTAAGNADAAARLVVAPYLIEVTTADGAVTPTSYRERIRASGPSIPYGPAERQLLAG